MSPKILSKVAAFLAATAVVGSTFCPTAHSGGVVLPSTFRHTRTQSPAVPSGSIAGFSSLSVEDDGGLVNILPWLEKLLDWVENMPSDEELVGKMDGLIDDLDVFLSEVGNPPTVVAGSTVRIGGQAVTETNAAAVGSGGSGQSQSDWTGPGGSVHSSAYISGGSATTVPSDPYLELEGEELGSGAWLLDLPPAGVVTSRASTGLGSVKKLKALATADAVGGSLALGRVVVGGAPPSLDSAMGVEAVAFGTGLPQAADVLPLLDANPIVKSAFVGPCPSDFMALMVLGGGYPTGNTNGSPHEFTGQLDLQFDLGGLASPQNLRVGLLDPVGTGSGFDSLTFSIVREGATVVEETFTSLGDALTYFDDNLLDLGPIGDGVGADGILDLTFKMALTISGVGDSFYTNFVVGNSGCTPVPEPSTLGLLGVTGLAVVGLVWRRRRR
ncbi:MAG: PEP-CTERM sorting domain-containing protein [Planctomycetota bacterium]